MNKSDKNIFKKNKSSKSEMNDDEINNFYMKHMSKIIISQPDKKNNANDFIDIVYSNIEIENFYILLNIKLSNIILNHIYKYNDN